MPRDVRDAEFVATVTRKLAQLILAVEVGSPERSVEALRELLMTITAHANPKGRKAAALARAVERV